MQKNTPIANASREKGSITAALAHTLSGNTLFEQLSTQACIHQASAHLIHCFTQCFITEPVSSLPTRKIPAFENLHYLLSTIPVTGIFFQQRELMKSQRGPKAV